MQKILVILGPTATGKTDLALSLGKKFNGELISCDSRQVYVGLDIGTGKLPSGKWKIESGRWKKEKGYWEMDGIKVWMTDVADPNTQFTVKDYVDQAEVVIEDITKRGKLPIIVGGTGLYLKALLEGLPNLAIPVDNKLRRELEKLSLEQLQIRLQLLSPARWEKLNNSDQQNPRRLLRSIELVSMNPYIKTQDVEKGLGSRMNILKIGLTAPREILKKRIFDRLLVRIDQGLIKEGENLNKEGLSFARMRELGLEYGVLADLLEYKIAEDQFVNILGRKICQFAKRQMTWFKRDKKVFWYDILDPLTIQKVEKEVRTWYDRHDDQTH